ncbi:MAG: hypothetical protein COT85_05965 [Chlamydiae bacterium CG10_big_fil_rev_8_21_14_0_10_42_34]|nr:MAG: hypothetical protein COT85_05965 [Chlamydiae bacterium CG10_big_fil_rev_8_21_14_0_10_42_34]
MKAKKRQKMCYNCEGEIDLDVIVCPFCAADLREEKPEQFQSSYHPTASVQNLNTQQSLYPPHYAPKAPEEEPAYQDPQAMMESDEETKSIVGPTILMTLGAQLLLFGLFMLFFSSKGALILKWDARMWFLYAFASIPLLIFGYRSISKL